MINLIKIENKERGRDKNRSREKNQGKETEVGQKKKRNGEAIEVNHPRENIKNKTIISKKIDFGAWIKKKRIRKGNNQVKKVNTEKDLETEKEKKINAEEISYSK